MKKRKLNQQQIDEMVNTIKEANVVLLETDKGGTIYGTAVDMLAAMSSLANHLYTETALEKEHILEAVKLGLDIESAFDDNTIEDTDKELDKLSEAFDKLSSLLKDLKDIKRKGEK